MVFGIFLLIVIILLWALFVEGWLWKIILFCAGWFGIVIALYNFVPESHNHAMTIGGQPISWAVVIATGVCLMALLTTKVKND